ncbi:MAG: DUF3866 family protein [Syntrophomonadaceae bacterium]|nr:DUF3866 family protein [Syntrophomonadaceae bacterium]
MIKLKRGKIVRILAQRPGLTEMVVELDGQEARAINYDDLTGTVEPGEEVLLNTTAVALGLGTGGSHFVVASLAGREKDISGPGHIMKLRYTPLQVRVLSVEEEDSPYREAMMRAESLEGISVLVGTLHSMLAPVCAVLKRYTGCRIAYLMTDGASLPMAFSRTVVELKEKGLLEGTVTCGHAFGGDLEAVNIYSGLLAARHVLGAEVIVVLMGPGIVGTGTRWGFTGVEQGEILNAVDTLQGVPIAIPRISFSDKRARHRGLSHHTLTVLSQVCKVSCLVPLPRLESEMMEDIFAQITGENLWSRHRFALEDGGSVQKALEHYGLRVTTMGRGLDEDREFFLACGACAAAAGKMVKGGKINYINAG